MVGDTVTVEGVVTADYRGASGYRGIVIQTPGSGGASDATPGASDGIFLYLNNANPPVAIGDKVTATARFAADDVPFDFRRPLPVWQVALADGTNVYVGTETGQIEAVRTRWWRTFDFVWGLHIMDLQTREDTHHPILIFFALLSVIGALFGCILMFRRRSARVGAK